MASNIETELKRREFLRVGSAAAGVAAAGGVLAHTNVAAASASEVPSNVAAGSMPSHAAPAPVAELPTTTLAGPQVSAYFGTLRSGVQIDRWRVIAVREVLLGAIPVVLATEDGDAFQVDVLRRDARIGSALGVGNTDHVSVFLSNGGDGSHATREEHGLGAMALAAALTARETEGARPPALMTLSERTGRFPHANFTVRA